MMSFDMVIKGPVANAGSIFILSSNKGTIVPKMLANITTAKRLSETAVVITRSPNMKKLYTNTTKLMMLALIIDTMLSADTASDAQQMSLHQAGAPGHCPSRSNPL